MTIVAEGTAMIDHKHRLIFVHIQKTGGNSICAALQEPDTPREKHCTALQLRDLYGPYAWNNYLKISVVRNPWDRLVSWWSMIDAARPQFEAGKRLNKFQTFVLRRARTFEQFLDCDEEIVDRDGPKWIYRNQIDHLSDTAGALMVDFVCRFERIEQDFETLCRDRLKLPIRLPHTNRSKHRHYTEFYSPGTADKVGERFDRDIARFGYAFGA